MNKATPLKAMLEQRLAALQARVANLETDLRAAHSADSEEQVTEREGEEVMEGLERSALEEISQIEATLKRIKLGTYGTCEACNEPIGNERLAALPYASRCLECA
jgi:RNA polymerase-binding transcription factor DksA